MYFSQSVNTEDTGKPFNYQEMINLYTGSISGYVFCIMNLVSILFVLPFKFYIGKEFFFILYDELANKSLSSKIDELKQFTSIKGVYTKDMVQQVRSDIYQLVR